MKYDFNTPINRRGTQSIKWDKFGDDVVPMWIADMDFRSPEPVIAALKSRVEHGVFGYGSEPKQLCETIATRLYNEYRWKVDPEAVVLLPGVVLGFNLACHALTEPGDGLLIQTPVYPPILRANRVAGLERNEMELTRLNDGSYEIDYDAFEAAITDRTRLFILCNPHNPVGRVFRQDELERMAEICFRHNVLICSDEIHCDLIYSNNRHIPVASLSPEIAEKTITLMAPSKTYNIAGLGCSFAVIPNADLRKQYYDACRGLVGEANILGLEATEVAYRDGQPWLDELISYLQENRDTLAAYVAEHLPGVKMGKPQGTYLAWLDCREAVPNEKPSDFFLREAKVAMNDGGTFGKGGEGFVRLNFGCPRPMLLDALDKMKAVLESVKA